MTITLTGAKYTPAALSAVGINTVTVSGTPFVASDFASPRRADLFSAGTANLVTNSGFDADTDWTKGSGVSIASGRLAASNAAYIAGQNVPLVPGRTYTLKFGFSKTGGHTVGIYNSTTEGVAKITDVNMNNVPGMVVSITFVAVGSGLVFGAVAALWSGTLDSVRIAETFPAYKGSAFVRACTATNALQIESEFIHLQTGAIATQAVGDSVYISKNWAESAQAGIAVSGPLVTVTDEVIFGNGSVEEGLTFHDESVIVISALTASNANAFKLAGGITTFGHLQSWAQKSWYGPVSLISTNPNTSNFLLSSANSATWCMYGGLIRGSGANPTYVGAGTDYKLLHLLDVKIDACDVVVNATLTNPAAHILENCSFSGSGSFQILLRFRNGTVLGGQYKLTNNATSPISIFGNDDVGTYAIGAPAGQRAVVLDTGNNNMLWRANNNVAQTINCTNLVSADYRMGTGLDTGAAQTSGSKNVYFADNYTNLRSASALGVICNATWTADSTTTAAASDAATAGLTLLHSTGTGYTLNPQRGPWTYRIRKHGYDEIEGVISETAYSLGTAGTAFDVAFGGYVNQIADPGITTTATVALATSAITVTDHGASPVTWMDKQWSITITVDLGTHPERTADEVYQHIKSGITQTAAWNSKTGLLWHVLMTKSGSNYATQRGQSGGAGAALKGVRVIDHTGAAYSAIATQQADDGTTISLTPPTTTTIACNVSLLGAEVRIYDLDNTPAGSLGTALAGIESCAGATYSFVASAGNTVWVQIMLAGYKEFGQSMVTPATSTTYTYILQADTNA